MLTDLKDDDEGQSGSQDVPKLQGEFVRHWAPGWSSVVSVPALFGLAAVCLPHFKHRQAAVHVASQTPEDKRRNHQTITRATLPACTLYLMLTHPHRCPHTGHIWRRKQSGGCSLRWWQWRRRLWWLPARRYLRESHARYLTAKPEENEHMSPLYKRKTVINKNRRFGTKSIGKILKMWQCDWNIMCSLQHFKCLRVDSSFNYRASCHKKHLVIYYMAVGVLCVVIWGGGVVGGEVQHMAV